VLVGWLVERLLNVGERVDWRLSHSHCKGNLTILRRILHLDLAKGNPK
jgi:hypothetical protein